jgi:predicted transcriptional regulator
MKYRYELLRRVFQASTGPMTVAQIGKGIQMEHSAIRRGLHLLVHAGAIEVAEGTKLGVSYKLGSKPWPTTEKHCLDDMPYRFPQVQAFFAKATGPVSTLDMLKTGTATERKTLKKSFGELCKMGAIKLVGCDQNKAFTYVLGDQPWPRRKEAERVVSEDGLNSFILPDIKAYFDKFKGPVHAHELARPAQDDVQELTRIRRAFSRLAKLGVLTMTPTGINQPSLFTRTDEPWPRCKTNNSKGTKENAKPDTGQRVESYSIKPKRDEAFADAMNGQRFEDHPAALRPTRPAVFVAHRHPFGQASQSTAALAVR